MGRTVRVAVVDIGTNSTRLLIADVDPATGAVEELLRRSRVTRLGHGVDSTGSLSK
jgi:exopolyphosphatase/guanosine-5'-triphosphate,3'-diphosphate pyrophosphatase